MDRFPKTARRAAMLIHEHVATSSAPRFSSAVPRYTWQAILRHEHQIQLALGRGWQRAARRLMEDLPEILDRFQREIGMVRYAVTDDKHLPAIPSPTEIYRDLVALQNEFAEVEIDLKKHTISVTTDRIVLENIRLGRFQVCLDWQGLTEAGCYRVIALDPNPAAHREDVPHPHVQDESLCEGEGRAAIRAALKQGRFYDFFLLVSQILHSYGRGSAYVELDDWEGEPCASCGGSTSDSNRYYCRACDDVLCEGCSATCAVCCESHCSSCLTTCSVCDEECCPDCRQTCSRCKNKACRNCLQDGVCATCRQELQENQDHDQSSTDQCGEGEQLSGAAHQPHGVGEAAVCA